MDLFNRLPKEEVEKIEKYIDLNIEEVRTASADHILRFWNENKQELANDIFGEELIISRPVTYVKDAQEMSNEFYRLIDRQSFMRDLRRALHPMQDKSELLDKHNQIAYSLLTLKSILDNRYTGDTFDLEHPVTKKKVVFQTGAKTMKLIAKLAEMYEVSGYEEFRIAQSQINNERSIKGTLCLSIHPLDFMTMSDNNCGWSSCMSWRENGDYRQGTVEMMNSPVVVCAYLKSSTDFTVGNSFSWNSKRWRELFIVNPQVGIFGIKGYPYWNSFLEKTTIEWIASILKERTDKYNDLTGTICNYLTSNNMVEYDSNDEEENKLLTFGTDMMYNDFCYEHKCMPIKNIIIDNLEYSGESECMCCGDTYDIEYNNNLVCTKCDTSIYCIECGERIYGDNYIIDVEGNYYCSYCADELLDRCESCGGYERNGNNVALIAIKGIIYDYYIPVCLNCVENLSYAKRMPTSIKNRFCRSAIYYLNIEDIVENKDTLNLLGMQTSWVRDFIEDVTRWNGVLGYTENQ